MEVLNQLFSHEEINKLIEENNELVYVSKEQLQSVLNFLATLMNHNNSKLRSIIQTNPDVLLRPRDQMEELIRKMKEYNFLNIPRMIEDYPYLLNTDAYEIDGFFIRKKQNGISIEEAIQELEKDPYKIEL